MRNAGQLNVGPLRFFLRTDGTGPARYSAPAYGGFYSEGSGSAFADPLCEMSVDVVRRAEAIPGGDPLWQAGSHWAVWEDGADLVFHVGLKVPEDAKSACRVARDLSRAEVMIPPVARTDETCESPLVYPLDQILSWGMLSRIGGALLHSAVAVKDGVGYVFAGRSGAGKSTLSGLCHAEGWRIMNDDRAMVFRRGGAWRVAGTPWHGSGCFAEAAEVPLGGIFFLQQASEDRVKPASASQARLALLDVAAVPWFEDSWAQGTLDGLARLVQEVETSRFQFTKTPAAVQVLTTRQTPRRAGACA